MKKETGMIILLISMFLLSGCLEENITTTNDCTSDQLFDNSRGACNQTLTVQPQVAIYSEGNIVEITSNSIPNHKVGLFGAGQGSLNPNAIRAQNNDYIITANPGEASSFTPLVGTRGPMYSFGVLLNGVELDPVAAEPFPHEGIMSPNANWEWNLEANNVSIGLDCNNAHVQPNGKYHYHGKPELYLENANLPTNTMNLIGYAADGFPIYYKYAYNNPMDPTSGVVAMESSYRLKSGNRPGDGITAPCGTYNGVYTNDYEFIEGLGDLDQANGRYGVTPEFPSGTYYYLITDEFPFVPRYFKGTPSNDFSIQ